MEVGKFLAAVACGFAVSTAQAQPAPPPQATSPVKIAFVNVERAIASTNEGRVKLRALDDWARPRQDEINQLAKELTDLQQAIMVRQATATQDELSDMNRKYITKKRQLEDKQRDAKADFNQRQTALLKDLGGKLQEVINNYAQKNQYTAVFILKSDDLAYLANDADITDIIVKLYNEAYPIAAPAPTATPSK
jgi:outer membrane protein